MTKKKTSKRKFVDWDSIEPLYRAGVLSLTEICRQYEADHLHSQAWKKTVDHSAISKKAKAKKWTRNLAGKVKSRIKEKLVTDQVTACDQGKTDEEIIEKVSEAGVNVVLRHRREIAALIDHENKLLAELGEEPTKTHVTSYLGSVTKTDLNLTVKEKTSTLKDLATVRAQRITLERQAYNLDEPEGQQDQNERTSTPEEVLRRFVFMLRNREEGNQGG